VWPGCGVRARASTLARACAEGRRAGALGTVVEVPIYGAPWCGTGTALQGAWCSLTAFLAAGLTRGDPEVGLSALQDVVDKRGASVATGHSASSLGDLLAAQLFEEHAVAGPCARPPVVTSPSVAKAAPAASVALALWDAVPASPPPTELLRPLLALLEGRLPSMRSSQLQNGVVAGANLWYQYLTERRQSLRQLSALPNEVAASARPSLCAALVGVEWLRFACRLLLLLTKQCVERDPEGQRGEGGLPELRAAIQTLPPTKGSDVRNGFLVLVERSTGASAGVVGPEELGVWSAIADTLSPLRGGADTEARQVAAARALWRGGLRLGAAMDLRPWVVFEARDRAATRAVPPATAA